MLPCGFTIGESYGALNKAWKGYCIALRENDDKNIIKYAGIIQKIESEMGLRIQDFGIANMHGYGFRHAKEIPEEFNERTGDEGLDNLLF